MASVQNAPQDMEYSAHLQQWKQAFSQFYAEQQPSGQAYVAQVRTWQLPHFVSSVIRSIVWLHSCCGCVRMRRPVSMLC